MITFSSHRSRAARRYALSRSLHVLASSLTCEDVRDWQEYKYGQFEIDRSGELPAKLFALWAAVLFPIAFCVGIVTANI